MKKKVLSLTLVIALVAIAAISTTLAYFTDTDAAHNTMTIGNVDIEQFEKQFTRDENGAITGVEDYLNDKTVMPAAGAPAWGETVDMGTLGYPSYTQKTFADNLNAQDKIVAVKNTGTQPVYFRTILLIEDYEELNGTPYAGSRLVVCSGDFYTQEDITGMLEVEDHDVIGDGTYTAIVFTHNAPLAVDATSTPSLVQVAIDQNCTQELAGLYNGKLDVFCFTQAVQEAGFEDAATALDTAFGDVTLQNISTWINSDDLTIAVAPSVNA